MAAAKGLLLWTLLIAAAGSVAAADLSSRRVAFVVGNSAYSNVPALKNPLNDAQAVAQALRRAGFDVVSAFDLDRVTFDSELQKFIRSVDGADVSLFYYSGHGIQVGGDNRLIPIDAGLKTAMDLEVETINVRTILGYMQSHSRKQIIFLDSCRNNPFPARSYFIGADTAPASRGGLAVQDAASGSLIAFSTQPGNVAEDGTGEFSPFTGAVLQYGFTLGTDLQTALMKVTREVSQQTGGRQVPWNNSSLTEPVYLARPSIMIASVEEEAPPQPAVQVDAVQPEQAPPVGNGLAQNVADLIGDAFERPQPVPIGVGAVAMLPDFPLLRGEPGVRIELSKPPSAGVLYLDQEALVAGSVLKPSNLRQVKYEPSIGSEGAEISMQWNVSEAADTTGVAVDGKVAPYVLDCDREAGEPLDPEGVSAGRLPNEIEPTLAVAACEQAVKQYPNVARYRYQLGRAKLAAKDIATAHALFREAADAGHTRALNQLGYMSQRGIGQPQNLDEAAEYFQRGAESGDPYAMAAHGRNLVLGRGIPADLELGVKYLNRAVEFGHTYAMNELGSMYYYGRVVKKNPNRGVRFYQAGLERKDIYSMNNLGIAYLEGSGVKKNAAKARELFIAASEGGHPYAPNNIGRMYFSGNGGKKDTAEAIRWYEIGAERGDSWAASNLGWVYSKGPKTLRNLEQAAWYYGLAVALDVLGQNPDAADGLKSLPDEAKGKAIRKLIAEIGTADIETTSDLNSTLVMLERRAWQTRNPRQDLF